MVPFAETLNDALALPPNSPIKITVSLFVTQAKEPRTYETGEGGSLVNGAAAGYGQVPNQSNNQDAVVEVPPTPPDRPMSLGRSKSGRMASASDVAVHIADPEEEGAYATSRDNLVQFFKKSQRPSPLESQLSGALPAVTPGRPNLKKMFLNISEDNAGLEDGRGAVSCLVCGPAKMSEQVSNLCFEFGFDFQAEEFII